MSTSQARIQAPEVINGLEVEKVMDVIGRIKSNTKNAGWKFRCENQWTGGARNQSEFKNYYSLGKETLHKDPFISKSDEPFELAGKDRGPNPVEHLLHALTSCLTTSLVAHAAVRGIEVEDLKTSTEGDIDIRGFLGLSDNVRKGYKAIRVKMRVKSPAQAEQLKELAEFSPVYDVVSNSLPVNLIVEKY